ncbi:MAG TPA: hypothetical protein VL988_00785 [Solirubrobacteraceae bacterium]|nr:hypothetical protein [Solirubrobacteraceae bacterium]
MVTTAVGVGVGYEVYRVERDEAAERAARATAYAYLLGFAEVQRGLKEIRRCHEKLNPFATGSYTRVDFDGLVRLSPVMSQRDLQALVAANGAVEAMYPPGYLAPRNGVAARRAYSRRIGQKAANAEGYLAAALSGLSAAAKRAIPSGPAFNCGGLGPPAA